MRNLVIKREKSYVASLAKMKVYIEDAASSEIIINNVPCRKLGDLKNGEEKGFIISEAGGKVFVIADKLSKNYCNEFYNIPAGTEDVFLSGKNKSNLATGNAFRFNGVVDEEVLKNRKKGTKIGIIVLVVAFIVGAIIGGLSGSGVFDGEVKPKVFSADGIEISLTSEFIKTDMDGYTACYGTEDVVVFILEESFSLMDGLEDYTIEEYGALVLQSNDFGDDITLQSQDGLTYFEYQSADTETNDTYVYFTVLYKETDAFWMVQFATLEENVETYRPDFIEWAKTVSFIN